MFAHICRRCDSGAERRGLAFDVLPWFGDCFWGFHDEVLMRGNDGKSVYSFWILVSQCFENDDTT
jgi:hypothetical protein